jgi:hypothetical protein
MKQLGPFWNLWTLTSWKIITKSSEIQWVRIVALVVTISDIKTMELRLARGNYYIYKEIFVADLKRICDNCRTYNAPNTVYFQCAEELDQEFLRKSHHWTLSEEPNDTVTPMEQ